MKGPARKSLAGPFILGGAWGQAPCSGVFFKGIWYSTGHRDSKPVPVSRYLAVMFAM